MSTVETPQPQPDIPLEQPPPEEGDQDSNVEEPDPVSDPELPAGE
jgi:hypothetical protein